MKYIYRFLDDEGGEVEVSQPMTDDAYTEIDGRPVARVLQPAKTGWGGFAPGLEDFWSSGDPEDVR